MDAGAPDVFISYAREDRPLAASLAAHLQKVALSWWDRALVPGTDFDQAIERALTAARVVIVLWSSHSVKSRWVRAEAGSGADRGVLIPCFVERGVRLPLEFSRIHTADLVGWEGEPDHPGMQELRSAVEEALSQRATVRRHETPTETAATPARTARLRGAVFAAALLVPIVALLLWAAFGDIRIIEPAYGVLSAPADSAEQLTGVDQSVLAVVVRENVGAIR